MYDVTYQNLCKKGTNPIENELSQSGLPVFRKIQKAAQNYPKMAKVDQQQQKTMCSALKELLGAQR